MQAERAEDIGADVEAEGAVPVAVRAFAAGQMDVDVVGPNGIQSMPWSSSQ
ncbi:hypothetical protein ACFQ9X_57275 [Catenulispora yoronensis]